MRSHFILALSVAIAYLPSTTGNATTGSPDARSTGKVAIVLRTSELRSAYLIRNGQTQYDVADMTPAGLRRQLQRHFDVVTVLLYLSAPKSIDVALDRLETTQNQSWTKADREAWRQRLMANRRTQILRLIEYRNRGVFPLNEGQAPHPVPIFVDCHDTACAVGHLMRLSGRNNDVAAIARDNNFIHVPDVTGGAIVDWILTSGITLEEAALIQPMYGFQRYLHPIPKHASEVFDDQQSFVFDELRFSNIKLFPIDGDTTAPAVNIPISHQFFCGGLTCGMTANFLDLVPILYDEVQLQERYERLVLQFDVEITSPVRRIAWLPSAGTLFTSGGPSIRLANELHLFANGTRDRLWIDYAASDVSDFLPPMDLIIPGPRGAPEIVNLPLRNPYKSDLKPTDRMTIVTEMLFRPGQDHQAQFISFSLITVPEPTATLCVVLALGWIGLSCPPRRSL